MKTLIVEDDFTARLVLQKVLARFGDCHVAVTGKEAVDAFREADAVGAGYDLVCMDIQMPEMDGQEAVKQIRAMEKERGILSATSAKIIMTTALDDVKDVARSFQELCDAYVVKPVDVATLLSYLKAFRLV